MLVRTFFVGCLMFVAGVAGADVYKCKDAKGAITFVDTPCPTDQSTVDHKVTNDRNTLGKQPAKAREKNVTSSSSRSSSASPNAASASSATASSGDSGRNSQRQRLVKMQTQSCIEAMQMPTGKVRCMTEAERADYLVRLRSTIEAVCS